jgi:transposase
MAQVGDQRNEFAAFVGIDWADQQHAVCLIDAKQGEEDVVEVDQSPEAIEQWATELLERYGGRRIAVALEQSRGALVYALLKYDFLVLFPVNPKQLARFREALAPSGSKDDPTDAQLLAHLLAQHTNCLKAWEPDDEETRLLKQLTEDRRQMVDERTVLTNRLKIRLKQYFPQALELIQDLRCELACLFLQQFTSLKELQAAEIAEVRSALSARCGPVPGDLEDKLARIADMRPLTTDRAVMESAQLYVQSLLRHLLKVVQAIRDYDERIEGLMESHPDAAIFCSLPGAGAALAPRLLVAFGSDRNRYKEATEIQQQTGIAPVIRASGQTRFVSSRWACNKYLRSTFHEFANMSRRYSSWASAYYKLQRSRGKKHHAAIRALAFKWQRIIFKCWKTRTCYDEMLYCSKLIARNSPLLAYLKPNDT